MAEVENEEEGNADVGAHEGGDRPLAGQEDLETVDQAQGSEQNYADVRGPGLELGFVWEIVLAQTLEVVRLVEPESGLKDIVSSRNYSLILGIRADLRLHSRSKR